MSQITAKAAAILNAGPADVYATIADYQRGHPRILPKGRLYDLRVEQGGYGDGTIIRLGHGAERLAATRHQQRLR